MIRDVVNSLLASLKTLVLTDLLLKAIAFALLTPLVSLIFRGFLAWSGRTVLADADIANFFLHPTGWLTLVVVGGASVAILALEQCALMTVSLAHSHGKQIHAVPCLRFIASKSPGIQQIAARMVLRVILLAAPLAAVGGGIWWALLTDHDINFYLTEKPPKFWGAVVMIGSLIVVFLCFVVRWVINWSLAMQLYLYEGVAPRRCLGESQRRVSGNRKTVLKWVLVWAVVNILIGGIATGLVAGLGKLVLLGAVSSLWRLILSLGFIVVLWGVTNLICNLIAVISFAVMQGHVYDRFGKTKAFQLPSIQDGNGWSMRFTRGRIVSATAIAVAVAALVGTSVIHTIRLDDDVQITAHRGASGRAPENTMASILAAIEDQADWVEIDVQESKDGVVMVAHDSDLKKVSGTNAKIWEMDADEMRSIDIGSYFGSEFSDQRVPTLAEVLKVCKGRAGVNIELKYYGHDQNLEQKVIDLVEQHEMQNSVVVMSLEATGIQKFKRLRPDYTVGLLSAVVFGDLTRVEADFLAVNTKLATRSLIESAHRNDKLVSAWTVNDRITMSVMISRGIDNLITDHPALGREVLAQRAQWSPVERLMVEVAYYFGAVPESSPNE